MNEEKPPPRMTRPANVNRPPEIRARRREQPASTESKFIGYLVLGFGILAVIAVVMLYFSRNKPQGEQTAQVPQKVVPTSNMAQTPLKKPGSIETVARDLAANFLPAPEATATRPPVKKTIDIKRQPDITPAQIEGDWQASIGNEAAALKMSNGVYQIILANPSNYGSRRYSSGNYKIIEDIIAFTPRNDWAAPKAPAGEDVQYQSITKSSFPVIAAMQGGKMVWKNPPYTETRVLVPNSFLLAPDGGPDFVIWQRLQ